MKPRIFKDHALHIEMWKWLAEHPDKEKREWPGWKSNGGSIKKVYCLCFACEVAEHSLPSPVSHQPHSCTNCPINWGLNIYCACIFCPNSPYDKFTRASLGSPDRTKYALEIAKLPLAKGWIDPKPRAYTCWVSGQDMAFTVYALDAHHARSVIALTQKVDYFMVGARLAKVEKRNFYEKRKRHGN